MKVSKVFGLNEIFSKSSHFPAPSLSKALISELSIETSSKVLAIFVPDWQTIY